VNLNTSYNEALEAARLAIKEGSIDEFYTRTNVLGIYRQIIAHSDQGWSTWYSDEWYFEHTDIAV
jgi:hypothetical protein